MSNRNESLRTYAQRVPQPQLQRDRGNWKWSAICASFYTENGGVFSPASIVDDTPVTIEVLLFLHDAPAILQACQRYATATPPGTANTALLGVSVKNVIEAADGVSLVTDAANAAVTVAEGEVLSGFTLTNDVPIKGYPADIAPLASGYATDNTGATAASATYEVCAIANSPVIEGKTLFNGTPGGIPVILDEASYTQAMFDAGNVATDTGSGETINIVGLYRITT
jgi:hypothetical protein